MGKSEVQKELFLLYGVHIDLYPLSKKCEPYTDTFTKCENETEIEMIRCLLKIYT